MAEGENAGRETCNNVGTAKARRFLSELSVAAVLVSLPIAGGEVARQGLCWPDAIYVGCTALALAWAVENIRATSAEIGEV